MQMVDIFVANFLSPLFLLWLVVCFSNQGNNCQVSTRVFQPSCFGAFSSTGETTRFTTFDVGWRQKSQQHIPKPLWRVLVLWTATANEFQILSHCTTKLNSWLTLSLFHHLFLLLGPDLPLLPLRLGSAVTASQPAGLLSNPHKHTLTLSSSSFPRSFPFFLWSPPAVYPRLDSPFPLCVLLCIAILCFPLLPRTVKAAVTASPPPCWSLRTTRRSKRTRSASVRGRRSRSWPPISRTCTLFTGQPTANRLLLKAGCRDMSWARPQSP